MKWLYRMKDDMHTAFYHLELAQGKSNYRLNMHSMSMAAQAQALQSVRLHSTTDIRDDLPMLNNRGLVPRDIFHGEPEQTRVIVGKSESEN